MNVSKEQEIRNVINHIEEAVWNGRHIDSIGYVMDLNNIDNKIEISADIIEPVHESFTTEPYFKFNNEAVDMQEAINKYIEMDKPYIFNQTEYNNLLKLPEETQKIFVKNLLEIETKLENVKNNGIGANSVRVQLFKKENEKEKLYTEKQKIEKEYIEISEKKEQNVKEINKYVEKIKNSHSFFNPINIINRIFARQEIEEQNKFYKSEAIRLEKENIKNTELIFEKMFYKNDLNKEIQKVEKEVKRLRKQYELENKEQINETEILKEKNMLFKIFEIDKMEEISNEKEITEIEEPNKE